MSISALLMVIAWSAGGVSAAAALAGISLQVRADQAWRRRDDAVLAGDVAGADQHQAERRQTALSAQRWTRRYAVLCVAAMLVLLIAMALK
ncbi:hypothetical protein [Streptomyces sp. NPDC050988]|uniref:hypothetical protein n=1 Tax=Streptomyces sp. NPDC050988 TaxID=3365637 RepID=UPI0037B1AC4D